MNPGALHMILQLNAFRIFCAAVMLLIHSGSYSQISPGPLTTVHAELEGMFNCTQCHTLGDKVSNDKCLACHTEIKSRIDNRKGYHASAEVRGQDCFKCHSEHHGRKFDIIRFDEQAFNHALTGFDLTGAHKETDCRECHNKQFIRDAEILKKPVSFLGLSTECVACHTDFHQGTLGTSCTDCHTTEAFVPASEFIHSETEFPLRGAHENVDCASCHAVSSRNGSSFQEFAGVAFTNCSSCHDDPHNGRFGANCKECHVEESFHLFRGQENFNHNKTGFPLVGQHKSVACAECHDTRVHADRMFKDFLGRDVSNCTACHEDVHDQKFGTDCRTCHSEQSFRSVNNFTVADHAKTDFPLEGKHEAVECRACHENSITDPLPFNQCMSCHEDYHEGQFESDNQSRDCAECHTVGGFAGSTFSFDQHLETAFPLTGAHLATPCFACHLDEDAWVFRNIGTQCVDCHEDIHEGSIEPELYPGQTCESCHITDSWRQVSFDHSRTGWALEGSHNTQGCIACHEPDQDVVAGRSVTFDGLNTECATCHDNVHREQFIVDGVTECSRCHGFDHWKPSDFNHDSARFVLEGAHLEVACAECHTETFDSQGPYTLYRLDKLECVDCHQ